MLICPKANICGVRERNCSHIVPHNPMETCWWDGPCGGGNLTEIKCITTEEKVKEKS